VVLNYSLEKIEHTVSMSLDGEKVTRGLIEERVRKVGEFIDLHLEENDIQSVIKNLESKFQITMNLGFTLVDSSHRPWVRNQSENIVWYYWNRYKQHLIKEGFGNNIVGQMDIITEEILDLLQNPYDEGKWQRKGLVVGHVQSGKTANYAGVVCKALDAGYRIVIIMAGLLNSLRKQTQGRIDTGVIGLDSSLMLEDIPLVKKIVGVGHFGCERWPVSITTAHADFNKRTATQQQAAINQFNQPLVFIVKKNVSILRNLIDWLKNNNFDLSRQPMLLIDDEADHASINTKKDDLDPAKTNERIRELLELFPKNVYVGYTATPFANIFINPDTPQEMMKDLFPENFIKTLGAPSNYLGANRIFIEDGLNTIREINDYEDFLPLKHKKDQLPEFLPESLKESIRVFILVCTLRVLRNQIKIHNSMLVNISRFTNIQSKLRLLIHNYIVQLRDAVFNYSALNESDALKNTELLAIYETWKREYSNIGFKWNEVQKSLKKSISLIEVIEVNSSANAEKEIDYSERNYPDGRNIIAVGGLSLSRGITLEGLSTTYILRNSIMYDTLMQMGRWFGFRTGYEDLCRIFMTENARGWYEYIALATEELRGEFRKMDELKKTPKDFGLCVRNHPDSLIVTARNKMRSAKTIIREIDLTGRLIETSRLYTADDKVTLNLNIMARLLKQLKNLEMKDKRDTSYPLFWRNVPYNYVSDFVESFQNHPESGITDSKVVKKYVEDLAKEENILEWNVLFVSVRSPDKDLNINIRQKELQEINAGIRRTTKPCTAGVLLSQRKLGAGGLDRIDLKENEVRETPLIMLHLLDCRLENAQNIPVFPNGTSAYGISFPGEKNGRRIKKLATYQVNTIWMNEQYGAEIEDDDDMGSEL